METTDYNAIKIIYLMENIVSAGNNVTIGIERDMA